MVCCVLSMGSPMVRSASRSSRRSIDPDWSTSYRRNAAIIRPSSSGWCTPPPPAAPAPAGTLVAVRMGVLVASAGPAYATLPAGSTPAVRMKSAAAKPSSGVPIVGATPKEGRAGERERELGRRALMA